MWAGWVTPEEEAQRRFDALGPYWEQMQREAADRAALEAEQWRSNWGDLRKGDAVMLSYGVSGDVLAVYDAEGCQIRLDGVIEELMLQHAKVRVMLECGRYGMPVVSEVVTVGPQDVEASEGVHVWGRISGKWHEKKRRGEVPGESPYWVN